MYVLTNIVSIVINAVILAMMIKLRDASCHCLVDWRNWFIVVYSSLVIVLSLVGIVMRLAGGKKKKNIKELSTLSTSMFVISLVMTASIGLNIYALYTYTKDLENSQCDCIVARNRSVIVDPTVSGYRTTSWLNCDTKRCCRTVLITNCYSTDDSTSCCWHCVYCC